MARHRRPRRRDHSEPGATGATEAGSYDPAIGWISVPDVLGVDEAAELAEACRAALAEVGDQTRIGDKAAAGTRRLVALVERVPAVQEVVQHTRLIAAVQAVLGAGISPGEVIFRSPQPGFGQQRLHADAMPRQTADAAPSCATAIIALTDFTPENGSTVVVPGSHLRPDIQRRAGALERHPDQIHLVGRAGTAFVFDGHVLHGGSINRSGRPRPALQVTWTPG